jgi:hypothetical protein
MGDDSVQAAENESVTEGGTEVVIADDATSQSSLEDSPYELVTSLPIWCPEDVEPVAGQNGCTAEFGSISLLMDYLNANGLTDDGTIWIPEADSSIPETGDAGQDGTQTAPGDAVEQDASGVNIIILDDSGNSLPLDSEEGASALLNGQPVWCPDGITPDNGGDSCTASAASLGLLVSMMENGSLEDGAIYIQETDAPVNEGASAEAGAGIQDPVEINEEPSAPVIMHDPIWCPDGVTPDPGNGGCTASFASLDLLITYLATIEATLGDGMIWIEDGTDTSSSSIVIDGGTLTNWATRMLTLQGGWGGTPGDGSITGSTTFSQSITVTGWQNTVVVQNLVIDGAAGTGLGIDTTDDVQVVDVSSNNNTGGGIDITASGGTISLTNVNTSGNATFGTRLNGGAVNVSGSNTFNTNGAGAPGADITHNGLDITTTGSVALDGIVADGNEYYGVLVTTDGTVSVQNAIVGQTLGNFRGMRINGNGAGQDVTFLNVTVDNSAGTGLSVFSLGDISAENMSASNNTTGLRFANSGGTGGVSIFGTNTFDSNGNVSIYVDSGNDVSIQGVTVSNATATSGMTVITPADIIVACSVFNNNALYGFEAVNFATLQINGVSFSGNGSGDYSTTGSGTVVINSSCTPTPGGGGGGSGSSGGSGSTVGGSSQPPTLNSVDLSGTGGSNAVELNCTDFGGTQLSLPNGDRVTYLCPNTGAVDLLSVEPDGENFPRVLPESVTFISGLDTHLTDNGVPATLTSGQVIVSFVIPVDMIGFEVMIFYWDGTNWLHLAGSFTDGKIVFNSGVKTEDGRFEASTNFTGLFVLVRI